MAVTYSKNDLPTLQKDKATCEANKIKYEGLVRDLQTNYDSLNTTGDAFYNLWLSRKKPSDHPEEKAEADRYYALRDAEGKLLATAKTNLQNAIICISEKTEAINSINTTGSFTSVANAPISGTTTIIIVVVVIIAIIAGIFLYRRYKK